MVKVGDRVRCLAGRSLGGNHGAGFVGVIHSIEDDIYCFTNGDIGYADQYEVVSDGPVRTVTRREIVPGDYGVVESVDVLRGRVRVMIDEVWLTADELDAAARTLSELAEALRDV